MNLRPIISDEQLRDFRDGLLPDAERRLVVIQLKVDDAVSQRFDEIRTELPAFKLANPSNDFSEKIMLKLASENLVKEPVYQRKSQWVIKGFFAVIGALFILSVLILLKSATTTNFHLPTLGVQFDWMKIINGKAFLWAVWLSCLLPGILLVFRKITMSERVVFVK